MNKVDVRGLTVLMDEATQLSNKAKLSKQEERRFSLVLAQISALKTGTVTLAELDQDRLQEDERRAGLPITHKLERPSTMDPMRRREIEEFRSFMTGAELRDQITGHPTQSTFTTSLGHFVPVQFLKDTFAALKPHDPLFDETAVTYLQTNNGQPLQIPLYGDIENVATYAAEGSDQSGNETDISKPGAVMLQAYSFRSPMWRVSLEALQDVEAAAGCIELFKAFAADRIARGVGKELLQGNGASGHILGLAPALLSSGLIPVAAVGSSANTGGSETGANSIGSQDLAKLYYSVNAAYRGSRKAAWLCNDNTLSYLSRIVTKQGLPLVTIDGVGQPWIYGKRVLVSPSMADIAPSNVSVIFGDLRYWATRCAWDSLTRIQKFSQVPGLVEQGEIGLRMFVRFDGALLWQDINSPAPFAILQQHS